MNHEQGEGSPAPRRKESQLFKIDLKLLVGLVVAFFSFVYLWNSGLYRIVPQLSNYSPFTQNFTGELPTSGSFSEPVTIQRQSNTGEGTEPNQSEYTPHNEYGADNNIAGSCIVVAGSGFGEIYKERSRASWLLASVGSGLTLEVLGQSENNWTPVRTYTSIGDVVVGWILSGDCK